MTPLTASGSPSASATVTAMSHTQRARPPESSGIAWGMPPLALARAQILAFRRGVGALDARLAHGPDSLRQAAWAGLQDSMPRAAVLSLHARVEGIRPESWEDPVFVQLWGPRYQVYVVAADDLA